MNFVPEHLHIDGDPAGAERYFTLPTQKPAPNIARVLLAFSGNGLSAGAAFVSLLAVPGGSVPANGQNNPTLPVIAEAAFAAGVATRFCNPNPNGVPQLIPAGWTVAVRASGWIVAANFFELQFLFAELTPEEAIQFVLNS